jgi:hypothetical protein
LYLSKLGELEHMRTIVLAVVAWLTSIASCGAYLWFLHDGQPNTAGDWSAAVTAGAVGLTLMVPVAYLPTMSGLKSTTVGRRWWLYPVVGASFCVVPWLVVGGIWGGPAVIFTLAAPEAVFVYSIFAPAGAVFGAGFAWMNVDATTESERAA